MADPVRLGLVSSLSRPGGNVTGAAHDPGFEIYEKRFELLKEAAPKISKVGILISQVIMEKTIAGAFTREAAKRAGLGIVLPMEGAFWREADYRPAFATMLREGVDAVSVTEANENWTYRRLIIALAEEHRLPAIYPAQMFVELGGLMSYGVAWENFGLRAAEVVAQILHGANPGEVPVSQPTNFEMSINLKTAKTIGIEVPSSLLVQADKVIE